MFYDIHKHFAYATARAVWFDCVSKTHKSSKHLDLCDRYLGFLFHVHQFNKKKKCLR